MGCSELESAALSHKISENALSLFSAFTRQNSRTKETLSVDLDSLWNFRKKSLFTLAE